MPSKRLPTVAIASALATSCALVATGVAQSPQPVSFELEMRDSETRSTFVDAPPKRRESAGDIFTLTSPLRDAEGRAAGRATAAFIQTSRSSAQGTATLALADGRIAVAGLERRATSRTLAVVGGTGAYTGATGTVTLTTVRGGTRLRVQLTR